MKEVRVRDCPEFLDIEETCGYLLHAPGKWCLGRCLHSWISKGGTQFLGKVVTTRSGALGSGIGEGFGCLGKESLVFTTRERWL